MMKEISLRKVGLQWSAAVLALLTVPILGQAALGQHPKRSLLGFRPPATNVAGIGSQKQTTFSPLVKQQIAILSQDKRVRTPAQRKMSSALLFTSRLDRGQPAVAGVPSLRAPKVDRDMVGRVLIDIKGSITPALEQAIRGMGGTIVGSYPRWNSMRVWLGSGWFETLAKRPEVRVFRQADKALRNSGGVESQGDTTHGSVGVRNTYGATGNGRKVGVISDSVDFSNNSIVSGDLPNTLEVLLDDPGQSGEGTAMLEIVHDVAPDAALAFASGTFGEAGMAQAILDLAAAGCDIIVDDLGYPLESPFQDGIISAAVDQVTTSGVLYFSAAGNQRSGVWEGDFVSAGPATGDLAGSGEVNRFPSGQLFNTQDFFCPVILNWADPNLAATNDYDLYLLDGSGSFVVDSSQDIQDGTQDPVEVLLDVQPDEQIVVIKFAGEDRALRLYAVPIFGPANMSEATTGETYGHAGAKGAFGVAAIDATIAYPATFTSVLGSLVTESFSSTGPRRVFYNADGTPITPGNFLFATNGGDLRYKPDFTAADNVATSTPGFDPFAGTSAAAPHAAAMAAQLRSLEYSLDTPTKKSYVFGPGLFRNELASAFATTALDIELPGWDSKAGSGVIMMDRAANQLVNFVSNLNVNSGFDSATITWTTSVPASSSVEVSTGPSDPNPITLDDPTLTTNHSVTVTGLAPQTTYEYIVSSGSDSGAVFGRINGTFKTVFIKNVTVTAIGSNQATISWETTFPANAVLTVARNASDPNPIVITDPTLVTNHSFVVTGLEEETNYIFTVFSETEPAPGGARAQETGSFKTKTLQEIIVTKAVLLNKSASIWQVEVTLKNLSKFSTAKNLRIDSVIFNANNTRTVLPVVITEMAPDTTATRIFLFNKLKLGTNVNARVTGSYTTPRATKRFSGTIKAIIL